MPLKRLLAALGLAAPEPPRATWSGELYDSPLHRWLDAGGFPWRATRGELAALHGVREDPAYRSPVIAVPTSLLDGSIHAFTAYADARYPLSVPATEFRGGVSVGDDARANIRHVVDRLAPHLGPTRILPVNDTLRADWAFGRAGLTLTVWPPNRYDDGARSEEDRRQRASCTIVLRTGFQPTATPQELAWLESFQPIARIRAQGADTRASMRVASVSDLDLAPVRELPDGLERLIGHVGLSGDGEALIVCERVLHLMPLARLTGFRIDQYRPGRSGPGGSWLTAQYAAEQPSGGLKPIGIPWEGPDSAEELGGKLAAATGRPLEIVDAGTED